MWGLEQSENPDPHRGGRSERSERPSGSAGAESSSAVSAGRSAGGDAVPPRPVPVPVAENPPQALRRNQRRAIAWGPVMLSPIVPHHGRQTGWGAICNLHVDRGEGASSTQCKKAVSYGGMDDATCIIRLKRWLCAGLHDDDFPPMNPRTHHVRMGGGAGSCEFRGGQRRG